MDTIEPYYSTNHMIEATVTAEIKGGYRLKVSVIDLGMYMDGWTLRASDKDDGWWLQPTAIRLGNKWRQIPEFDHSKAFWKEIRETCLQAVVTYVHTVEAEEDYSQETINQQVSKAIDDASNDTGSKAVSWLND